MKWCWRLCGWSFTATNTEPRAWKSFDWDTLDRLYEKGLISDPKSKAKSVALTDEAVKLSESLFKKHFGAKP